jgi:hypothetical protein
MLTKDDYQCALDVQDACNLSGVAFAFARFMQKLCDEGMDTDERNTHPIAQLWVDKMAHLTGTQSQSLSDACRVYEHVNIMATLGD